MSEPTNDAKQDGHVLISRILDAPPELVFRAWTDPAEFAAWYGPANMHTPRDRVHIDLRAGGRYDFVMVSPDGSSEFAIGYDIVELDVPKLLVLRSDPMFDAGLAEPTTMRLTLEDLEGRTRMTLTDGPMPAPGVARAEAGYSAAFEKLASHLLT